jgi:hypothetical protein
LVKPSTLRHFFKCWTLKMVAVCYYETLVISHQSTQWNLPEELNLLQNINCLKDWYLIKFIGPRKFVLIAALNQTVCLHCCCRVSSLVMESRRRCRPLRW